jgi:hypothetical protein
MSEAVKEHTFIDDCASSGEISLGSSTRQLLLGCLSFKVLNAAFASLHLPSNPKGRR